MRLPENNGRLFVGGVAPGTGDEDLRRHFCRYGEVTDVCQPKDRLSGLPRGFAFVQFPSPADAGNAIASRGHVINGQQVNVARARPRGACNNKYKPLCQRIFWWRKHGYRVGDTLKICAGPLGDDYEECEAVNTVREFGVLVDKTLHCECLIGYISPDGNECMVKWPPLVHGNHGHGPQGSIVPAWTCSLKDLAQFSSNGNLAASANSCRYCLGFSQGCAATAHSCYPPVGGSVGHAPSSAKPSHPKAAPSQNWSWLVFRRPGY